MKIKDFVENYEKRPDQTKEKYLKDNLKIVKYIPFIKKVTLIQNVVNLSTYIYENDYKEDGSVVRKRTNKVKLDSVVQYILFCRLVIENYTNLEAETQGFFEEYDLLKQSGLLDKLMVGEEGVPPIIPASEIVELRMLLETKQKDELSNYHTPQSYVERQVETFGNLIGVSLKPIIKHFTDKLENMTEEEAEKFGKKLDKMFSRVTK